MLAGRLHSFRRQILTFWTHWVVRAVREGAAPPDLSYREEREEDSKGSGQECWEVGRQEADRLWRDYRRNWSICYFLREKNSNSIVEGKTIFLRLEMVGVWWMIRALVLNTVDLW